MPALHCATAPAESVEATGFQCEGAHGLSALLQPHQFHQLVGRFYSLFIRHTMRAMFDGMSCVASTPTNPLLSGPVLPCNCHITYIGETFCTYVKPVHQPFFLICQQVLQLKAGGDCVLLELMIWSAFCKPTPSVS